MIQKNQILHRTNRKPILYDVFYNKSNVPKPLVIFCHGYKGFKDWGAWDLMAKVFMNADLFFIKFNFSHNGGTMENPIDFPDLDAFAENNYTKELDDIDSILDHILDHNSPFTDEIDKEQITLIGHSRGGGIAIIKASEESRIKKLITFASVSNFGQRSSTIGDLEQWKRNGVKYVMNSRTKQMMPHNYQFYLNYMANKERLDIEKAEKELKIPHLIIHAKDDPSVKYLEAELLKSWNPSAQLKVISNSDHIFGAKHPWDTLLIPRALNEVVKECIGFIK
jgi:pimeloyl-ACP methyl ester carboxylesterase